ncbi:MAG TPA: acetyl ornithine aminotransferase family protein [Firmicutes bacterium]|nr:acetyl ornithine aminotransferase family protein [Bacillota bacterium]
MASKGLGISRVGRNAKRLMEIDKKFISPSYTRVYPLFMSRGRGAYVWDVDGNRFLDFTSGIGVTSTGHSHPGVVKAIQEQARKFLHMSGSDFYYDTEILLAEKLASITPGPKNKKVFFCNSGAEAVEAAMKLARYSTGRQYFIAFLGSFHGRTLGALSLTSSKYVQRSRFAPLTPGVVHVAYGDCEHCSYGLKYPGCDIACVSYIEDVIFRRYVAPEEVAAIFVEPILGEGGYIVPPPEFHPRLKELASKYGILFVADEVQSGMGRTGKMFAIEHWGVVPDIVTVAKGVASGMPLGATVASSKIMKWKPGSHGSTFGGNPVSCAAALATIKLLEGGLIKNAARMGDYIMKRLKPLSESFRHIGRISGKGLMIGIEIVKDKKSGKAYPELRDRIVEACFWKGLLILPCGPSSVRFVPPLVIGRKEADTALRIFEEVLSDTESRRR